MQTFTLYELNSLVRQVLETQLRREYWVEAELSECRESHGHCYMELVQKDEGNNTPIARAQAKCWRNTWAIVRPHFERITGQQMHAGMKVRLKVYAQFHETYGFSWIVTDLDPSFTLGDMARQRQEVIDKLRREGIFDMQRELQLPLFCQNIAVISAPTAAGYGDFVDQLIHNDYGLSFHVQLFPAVMQGEQVEQSIIEALNAIYQSIDAATSAHPSLSLFDCVVIIRGGGATSDLASFDTLRLAENVAQFPLPIITGIGHDRDESVLDMVSHTRVKTPTAAAALLIDHLHKVQLHIDNCEERLLRHVHGTMQIEQLRLARLAERIPTLFALVSSRQQRQIDALQQRLSTSINQRIEHEQGRFPLFWSRLMVSTERRLLKERHLLELLQQRSASLNPALLLQRGYSITLHKGKAVRSAAQVLPDDLIETRLADGSLLSQVVKPTTSQSQ